MAEIETQTDENGYFSVTKEIGPEATGLFAWAIPDQYVELRAKLIEPRGMVVVGTLDIDAADGSPSNSAKEVRLETGKEISLGSWWIPPDEKSIVVVRGRTIPKLSRGTLKVEVGKA